MGTDVVVLVHLVHTGSPGEELLQKEVTDALERLEARWSRFRPTSDVSMLNAADGHAVVVSPETFDLVARAIDAWRATGHRYDPTILPGLLAAGYDTTFEALDLEGRATMSDEPAPTPGPAPGCDGITLDRVVGAIRLPKGVAIDLGGIGKGRAADLLAQSLTRTEGVAGALVDLGGDLRAVGEPPRPEGWLVEVDDPLDTGATGRLSLRDGAVATSTRLRRAWTRGDRALHHLIDPRTGRPSDSGLASVTVVAGTACRAEVLAKAAFIAGRQEGAELIELSGATGLLVTDAGEVIDLPGLAPFRT